MKDMDIDNGHVLIDNIPIPIPIQHAAAYIRTRNNDIQLNYNFRCKASSDPTSVEESNTCSNSQKRFSICGSKNQTVIGPCQRFQEGKERG